MPSLGLQVCPAVSPIMSMTPDGSVRVIDDVVFAVAAGDDAAAQIHGDHVEMRCTDVHAEHVPQALVEAQQNRPPPSAGLAHASLFHKTRLQQQID